MKRERCWVWFRGGLNEASHWVGGFYATKDDQEGVLVQHGSFRDTKSSRVADHAKRACRPSRSSSHSRQCGLADPLDGVAIDHD